MIVTFRSKATGELVMLSQHAIPLLHAAGKALDIATAERGVFTAEQLPAAIAGIQQAIHMSSDPSFNEDDPEEREKAQQYVSLKQRAFPLLDMFERSHAKSADVLWETSDQA